MGDTSSQAPERLSIYRSIESAKKRVRRKIFRHGGGRMTAAVAGEGVVGGEREKRERMEVLCVCELVNK